MDISNQAKNLLLNRTCKTCYYRDREYPVCLFGEKQSILLEDGVCENWEDEREYSG